MKRSALALSPLAGLLASLLVTTGAYAQCDSMAEGSETVSGIVYDDLNQDGQHSSGEPGVAGVSVSNGCDVVLTDVDGLYEIGLAPEQILFVSQPTGYVVPVDENNLPLFFYSHYPDGTPTAIGGTSVEWLWPVIEPTGPLPDNIDFALHRVSSEETRFTAHAFADPQARSDLGEDMLREELVNTLLGNPYQAEFADHRLATWSSIISASTTATRKCSGLIGIPQWNLPGNHDMNYESPNAHYANETYKKHFGPIYYSFNYANAHIVALNNVEYAGRRGSDNGRYRGFISDDQIHWLERDLANVDRDKLIVIATHISLISEASDGDPSHDVTGPKTDNFDQLLELLRPFATSLVLPT